MKKILVMAFILLSALLSAKVIIDKAMPLPGESIEDYEITSVWEHYCIMDLNKLPQDATEADLNNYLDNFIGTEGYYELYEVYHQ